MEIRAINADEKEDVVSEGCAPLFYTQARTGNGQFDADGARACLRAPQE